MNGLVEAIGCHAKAIKVLPLQELIREVYQYSPEAESWHVLKGGSRGTEESGEQALPLLLQTLTDGDCFRQYDLLTLPEPKAIQFYGPASRIDQSVLLRKPAPYALSTLIWVRLGNERDRFYAAPNREQRLWRCLETSRDILKSSLCAAVVCIYPEALEVYVLGRECDFRMLDGYGQMHSFEKVPIWQIDLIAEITSFLTLFDKKTFELAIMSDLNIQPDERRGQMQQLRTALARYYRRLGEEIFTATLTTVLAGYK